MAIQDNAQQKQKTLITLLPKEKMLERLREIDGNSHIDRLWQKIANNSGQRVPLGIILMVELAIHDYTQGMPGIMSNLINMRMPDILAAVVSNSLQYIEVMKEWESVQQSA